MKKPNTVEYLEDMYDDLCVKIDERNGTSGTQIDGVGLDGDWDMMTNEEKTNALNAGIAEAESRLEEYHD